MYLDQNKVYGIWFDSDYVRWILGLMSMLAEGKQSYGVALSNQDTFCPSLTKEWVDYFYLKWSYPTEAIIKCVSGD